MQNCSACEAGLCLRALTRAEGRQLRGLLKLLRSHADLIALRDLIQAEKHLQTIPPSRHTGG